MTDADHPPGAEEVLTVLRDHVLDVWFPRSLDREHGGFLSDFDRRWRPCGPQEKLLEGQARQTLLAAEVCRDLDERYADVADHGFRYLRDVLWDDAAGGWFHRVDRAGHALEAETKHLHGFAYAIMACAAVYEATGIPDALELARAGFAWSERHAHDVEHGGFFGYLLRDGTPIRDRKDCPRDARVDTIGTPIGLKDANVHSDLLEAFLLLYRAWPDSTLAGRAREMLELASTRFLGVSGEGSFFCSEDLTPVGPVVRLGQDLQLVPRLVLADETLGGSTGASAQALPLLDAVLRASLDRRRGGLRHVDPETEPEVVAFSGVGARAKEWWVQWEGLKALATAQRLDPANAVYADQLLHHWQYLCRNFLDPRHGGGYTWGLEAVPAWRRGLGPAFAPARFTRKASVWKDPSHDGRTLLYWAGLLATDG